MPFPNWGSLYLGFYPCNRLRFQSYGKVLSTNSKVIALVEPEIYAPPIYGLPIKVKCTVTRTAYPFLSNAMCNAFVLCQLHANYAVIWKHMYHLTMLVNMSYSLLKLSIKVFSVWLTRSCDI
jgi:hypothetical protein